MTTVEHDVKYNRKEGGIVKKKRMVKKRKERNGNASLL